MAAFLVPQLKFYTTICYFSFVSINLRRYSRSSALSEEYRLISAGQKECRNEGQNAVVADAHSPTSFLNETSTLSMKITQTVVFPVYWSIDAHHSHSTSRNWNHQLCKDGSKVETTWLFTTNPVSQLGGLKSELSHNFGGKFLDLSGFSSWNRRFTLVH